MQNIYLQSSEDAFKGPSTAQVPDTIELVSFSHGLSMPLTANSVSHTGRTHGRCFHQDMTVTKFLDQTSPKFAQYCSSGHDAGAFYIRVFQADQNNASYLPIEYLQVIMENVIISSYSVSGGGGDRPIETITLNYSKITWIYKPQVKDNPGASDGNVPAGWDLTTNGPHTGTAKPAVAAKSAGG